MKKILVPCDFSPSAKKAFKFAVNIAQKNKSELYVLFVIDNSYINSSTALEVSHIAVLNAFFMQQLEEQINEKFLEMKRLYAPDALSISLKIDIGSLTQTVENYIRDKNIDLVVMGTHGTSGVKEFFVGSNTEKIVRYSPVPVFAVPETANLDSIRNILFPVMPGHPINAFVNEIKSLQNFFQAKLHLLWVNTPHIFKIDREAMQQLKDFAISYHFDNYTLNVRNDYSEQEGILHFTHEINADLIAMPTHSRKGLMHWLTGSITEDVVNHVHCPVWTYSIKE